jgi:hypothetical protein
MLAESVVAIQPVLSEILESLVIPHFPQIFVLSLDYDFRRLCKPARTASYITSGMNM